MAPLGIEARFLTLPTPNLLSTTQSYLDTKSSPEKYYLYHSFQHNYHYSKFRQQVLIILKTIRVTTEVPHCSNMEKT
jgi:hypothetical protein